MRHDPEDIWSSAYSEKYEDANYGPGLAGWVMRKSHALVEKPFGAECKFSRVLEVGSGSGVHIGFVRHSFDEYLMTDFSDEMLKEAKGLKYEGVRSAVEDATNLSFQDCQFDRVIAAHVLEHLVRPHEVLREWARVLKPGGTLSLVLPCDPGLAWRFGRNLGPRQTAKANGLAYDYVMAREHVNSITNLVSFIRYYFDNREECWWPTKIPFSDVNLIYAVNIRI